MLAFGSFALDTDRRQLLRDGAPVALSSRGYDILALLIEHRERVVSKDEIMSCVWRGMIVEENNLAVQISALRRALADGSDRASVIMTVPAQGYRFIGRIGEAEPDAPAMLAPRPEPAGAQSAAVSPARRRPVLIACLGACVLALAGVALLRPARHPVINAPPRLSIAVLPFRDLSDDRCCDYFADAISDDLTTDLSLIPGSVVIARESADVYRGHPAPAGEIGRALGVRYLLEGSLRAVDGAFSINAQLVDAKANTHLWAERFTVPRAHLADAQNAIVQRLSSALGVKLVDIEGARSVREHADDPDALDLFLRARSILDRADDLAAMNQAQALLEQAIARQPDDVAALSELNWLLIRKYNNYVSPHRERDLAEARSLIARATALAPRDAEVLSGKAALQALDGDCPSAQITYQAALDANPRSVRALTGQTVCKFQLGQFGDALNSLTALLRIDPEGPHERSRLYQMGFAELMMGKPADALVRLRRSLQMAQTSTATEEDLSLAEWTRACLVAATRLAGDEAGSAALFADYHRRWPYRSTWTLESRSPRVFPPIAGFRHFLDVLQAVGMPRYVDENWGPAEGPCTTRDFSPTPHAVPGLKTVDTAALATMLGRAKPYVIDFGPGAAVPLAARLSTLDPASTIDVEALVKQLQSEKNAGVVIMGSGALDPRGCQVALALSAHAIDAAWYRGGEEGWAKAGYPTQDLR